MAENSVSILFVGDGFPVPLHSGLFTALPNPFGRFFRLLREAKRLPYAPLVEEFQKTAQKNGLYDDRLPEIRWRFPHQCAHWFGMTVFFDARSFLCKFQFVSVLTKDSLYSNFTICLRKPTACTCYWFPTDLFRFNHPEGIPELSIVHCQLKRDFPCILFLFGL